MEWNTGSSWSFRWPSVVHDSKGAFVWDQSGIRIIGIMWVSVCLGAILILEYLDFHFGYSTPRSRIADIFRNIFRNKFLFRNIPNERALNYNNGIIIEAKNKITFRQRNIGRNAWPILSVFLNANGLPRQFGGASWNWKLLNWKLLNFSNICVVLCQIP